MAVVRAIDRSDVLSSPAVPPATDAPSFQRQLSQAALFNVPLNIEGVAEYLGLEVIEELMADDISGYLEFKSGRWVVGVNALHHKHRRRFTIAHEIAHFLLHRDTSDRFVDETFARREGRADAMEREADDFAAQLIMPEAYVRDAIKGGMHSLTDLAAMFQVSILAMKYRVKNLGYAVR